MNCNCKNVTNQDELKEVIDERVKTVKFSFFTKLKIILEFLQLQFYLTSSSVINFIKYNEFRAEIPSSLIKKYNSQQYG